MSKIFISYGRDASHGQHLATEAQQQLQAAGFEVFRDVIGLKSGDIWHSKLEYELDSSDLVVLVISEKIRTSDWVYNEFSMAREIGLPIILLIAEIIRMPLWLRHLQTLDFSDQADWSRLFDAIGNHVAMPLRDSEEGLISIASKGRIRTNEPNESALSWANKTGKDQYGQYADLQVNEVTQRFRLISLGTFWMGSPESEVAHFGDETQHQVTFTKPFWLADTVVTQALWLAILGKNPSRFNSDMNNPVEQVSWDDAKVFIQTLNDQISGLDARLPTEAQWEYACRAGTHTPFAFGENITPEQVNYATSKPYNNGRKGLHRGKTVPVKSLPANVWGLYEMHGNVWEWCCDSWQADLGGELVTDPENNDAGAECVIRGGSWRNLGRGVRSAYRRHYPPDGRDSGLGLRLSLVTSASSGGGSG